jgi:hypothetical protein
MIEDWRYNPERLDDRRFCLAALVMHGCQIDRKVYEFCHDYTSSGACQGMLGQVTEGKGAPEAFRVVYDAFQSWLIETDQGTDYELVQQEGVDKIG